MRKVGGQSRHSRPAPYQRQALGSPIRHSPSNRLHSTDGQICATPWVSRGGSLPLPAAKAIGWLPQTPDRRASALPDFRLFRGTAVNGSVRGAWKARDAIAAHTTFLRNAPRPDWPDEGLARSASRDASSSVRGCLEEVQVVSCIFVTAGFWAAGRPRRQGFAPVRSGQVMMVTRGAEASSRR